MQCPKCQKQISNSATFCGYCGETIILKKEEIYETIKEESNKDNKTKSKPNSFIMILLCLLIAVVLGVGAFFIAESIINNNPVVINQPSEDKETEEQDEAEEIVTESDSADGTQEKEPSKTSTVKAESNSFSASSTLPNEGNLTYYPANAFDGDITTAWVEGVSGTGIGENLSISFGESVNIQAFGFDNGYLKSENLYYKNSRPKRLKFVFETENGMEETSFSFDDKYDGDFFFHYENSFKQVKKINIYIEDVYVGTKYEDTCITDIFFYDENMQVIDLQ